MASRSRCSYRFVDVIEFSAAQLGDGQNIISSAPSPPFGEFSVTRSFGVDPAELMAGSRITGGYLTVQLMDYSIAFADPTITVIPGLITTPRIPIIVRLGPFVRYWWLKGEGDIGIGGLEDNYILRIPLSDVGFGRLSNDSVTFALDTVRIGLDEARFLTYGSDPLRFPKLFLRPVRLSLLVGVYVGDPGSDVLGTE